MARIAFLTFGILRNDRSHPDIQGFVDRIPDNYGTAELCDGFIGRSELDTSTGDHSWGEFVPSRLAPTDDRRLYAKTLTLWEDLESVYAFSYSGVHAEALKLRREWFLEPQWPTYVAWWVPDDHTPDWAEANARHEHLHDSGSTAFAFDFKRPYDVEGNLVALDRDVVKRKMAVNLTAL